MGGWRAPPRSCSGKALAVSDVARWWDSKMVSFLCVLSISCILFPSWSCCLSLSYCLCNKHILLSSFRDWDSSCCKGFAYIPPSDLSIFCTAPSIHWVRLDCRKFAITPSDIVAAGAVAQTDVCTWISFWLGTITAFSTRGFADIPLHEGGKAKGVISQFLKQGLKEKTCRSWGIRSGKVLWT